LSGFSGLIYESLWTHYLKLFLGHAAYAQTLVLAIFMAGLAIGSWICSLRSRRWANLLAGYALAEGIIGLAALVFHPVFTMVVEATYSQVNPWLTSAASVTVLKWTLGTALILPQSILLGMTFPLMAGGLIRTFPDRPGSSLASLYFCNSIGAAAGVLISGFFLIPRIGLPGTGVTAGVLNLLLALAVWRMARDLPQRTPQSDVEASDPLTAAPYRLLLAVSLLTGASSFIYEVGWIRMLSLVLGSSTQAFELMLSAFILGLALGGLWVRRLVERLEDPVRFLGGVQVAMGVFAVATLPVYGWTLPVMRWLVETLPRTSMGYLEFNVASHAIAMVVMLPAAFFAGSTLPLLTYVLVRSGRGEASIGAVYGANTVGAIAGIAAAVHIGLPMLGLKLLIVTGAAVDIGLGLVLLWISRTDHRVPVFATALGVAALGLATAGVQLDPLLMASGVFRAGQPVLTEDANLLFHRDGKTATVHVTEQNAVVAIRTNGKIDATVRMLREFPVAGDEPTQVLSAALPLLIHPTARTAANIGLGSGMTTHVLLSVPGMVAVDTIEIEPAMIEGAESFRPRNERAYTDPRSRIVVDDAKTFFSTRRQAYDIIISEPSNPWVSGTASLFSIEFYRLVRQHLSADGLFVQWLQLYEFDVDLVASVLKAMGQHFDDYAIYQSNGSDILIVATNGRSVPMPQAGPLVHPGLAEELRRVGVQSLQDVLIRKIGDRRLLEPWLRTTSIRANSDFRPVLYHRAARARFFQENAGSLTTLARGPLPVLEMLGDSVVPWVSTDVTAEEHFSPAYHATVARMARDLILVGQEPESDFPPAEERSEVNPAAKEARELVQRCMASGVGDRPALYALGWSLAGHLRPEELSAVWSGIEALPCGSNLTQVEQDWMALFRAVGSRQPREIAAAAERLLTAEARTSVRRAYAVAAGMLGYLAAGAPEDARALRQRNEPVEGRELSFLLSVLDAHARLE
jgi:predicted membrane-bound spermidine synthase